MTVRRWWLPNLLWTLAVIGASVVLLLMYARERGSAACEGCRPSGSPWNGWVAFIVVLLGSVAIVGGNAIILLVAGAVRHRRRRGDARA